MDWTNLAIGVCIGLLLTLVLGWLRNVYMKWVKARDAYRKPQVVVHVTDKTPAQVSHASDSASVKIWLMRIAVIFALWIGIAYFYPDFAAGVYSAITGMFNALFG